MIATQLPANSFLSDVRVFGVDSEGRLAETVGDPLESLPQLALETGRAEITIDDGALQQDASAAIAIPVHRGGRVVSIVVLVAKQLSIQSDDLVGVLEVWEPVAPYEELALKTGYYGKMERFHNVSSYVRFEKGNGLPGQVWRECRSIIHDDLANHPGFLRAAGASAELLRTAIGIPVQSETFRGAALLISSPVSPIARGFEVWRAGDDQFTLVEAAYQDPDGGRTLQDTLPEDQGLPGLARAAGGAVLCDDPELVQAGVADAADREVFAVWPSRCMNRIP